MIWDSLIIYKSFSFSSRSEEVLFEADVENDNEAAAADEDGHPSWRCAARAAD
ncbi:jg13756, partial [Pararge aegeria aegeria]